MMLTMMVLVWVRRMCVCCSGRTVAVFVDRHVVVCGEEIHRVERDLDVDVRVPGHDLYERDVRPALFSIERTLRR